MARPFLLALLLVFTVSAPVATAHNALQTSHTATLTLAGTIVEITLPFAAPEFVQSAPGDAIQIATAARWQPFLEISLSAEPIAAGAPGAGAPGRLAASPAALRDTLQSLRAGQQARALPAHRLQLFGQAVDSLSNQVALNLRAEEKEALVVHEWVGQANRQHWVFRVSYTPGQAIDETLLDQIQIRVTGTTPVPAAPELAPPPGSAPLAEDGSASAAPGAAAALPATSLLPTPTWWRGLCDTDYYSYYAGRRAYPLGASYRGVQACGPRPSADGAPDVVVRFYDKAHGALEWECVELSMRFMWLAYQVPPYSGNGKDVVNNYLGERLVKIYNDTAGKAPQPGDVLSYGITSTWGHTSVVSASNVDSNGNGSITIIEQNWSPYGTQNLKVEKWHVYASMIVTGWLHDPYAVVLTRPDNNALLERFDPVTLSWEPTRDAKNYTIELTGPGISASTTISGTSVLLSADAPAGVYQWRVLAQTTQGKTEESMRRTFYRRYGPPTHVIAAPANATEVILTWAPSVDAPDKIEGYHIYCGAQLVDSVAAQATSYSADKTACPLNDYAVSAYKAGLESSRRPANLIQTYLPAVLKD